MLLLFEMDQVIPILPCPDIKKQVAFYQQLGFNVLGLYTSPNPYAVVRLGGVELHFYGNRKMVPFQNAAMCFIRVADVDAIYQTFARNLKQNSGKVPRSGIPRITKVRDLTQDRRFTLTDTGGNTLYIGTPVPAGTRNFFRTLQNKAFAQKFALLYDVVYSKEDAALAAKMLSQYQINKELLQDLDKAKFLLLLLEIQRALEQPVETMELKALLEIQPDDQPNWQKIKAKFLALLTQEI